MNHENDQKMVFRTPGDLETIHAELCNVLPGDEGFYLVCYQSAPETLSKLPPGEVPVWTLVARIAMSPATFFVFSERVAAEMAAFKQRWGGDPPPRSSMQ